MQRFIFVVIIFYASAIWADPVHIENIRIWAAPDSTRVVFDMSESVTHKLLMLSDPFRAVVDLEETALTGEVVQPLSSDRYVRQIRNARHDNNLRIVLDLKKFAVANVFELPPNQQYGHRLVVDLLADENKRMSEEVTLDFEKSANQLRKVVIAIDAGHGGEDPGSIGPSKTYEKHVVLSIARKLADKINSVYGMQGVLIREGDYYLSLRKRIEKARQSKADLFISIHADSFREPSVAGSSVYVLSQKGASSEHARWLAERENASDLIGGVKLEDKGNVLASVLLDLSQTASLEASIGVADRVLDDLKKVGKLHKRQVESAAFMVLKSPDIPSILVETAYISNPIEERKLNSPDYQDKLASAIRDGLQSYFRVNQPINTLMAMSREHVISKGDTLSDIAQLYQVSLKSLRQENGLQSDRIRVGQKLTIPSSGS